MIYIFIFFNRRLSLEPDMSWADSWRYVTRYVYVCVCVCLYVWSVVTAHVDLIDKAVITGK